MAERKVVSTHIVTCVERVGEVNQAVVIVFDNGDVEVRCPGGCGEYCKYGKQVKG